MDFGAIVRNAGNATDDAVIVTAVLRSVVRRAGLDQLRSHWPGAAGKTRTGRQLGNPVLLTEGRVTVTDGLLAVAVLIGY